MSRSEWLRHQVEAGRTQLLALDPRTESDSDDDLRTTVIEAIPENDSASPEAIIETVLDPVEDDIYELLTELQNDDEIGFDPREGGYRRR
jgi:hypothetical protein